MSKKKSSTRYEPPEPPTPVTNKPLWEVEVMTSPEGPIHVKVRANTPGEARNLAVASAIRRPEVWHILDTGEPVRLTPPELRGLA